MIEPIFYSYDKSVVKFSKISAQYIKKIYEHSWLWKLCSCRWFFVLKVLTVTCV